ncbi:MAG: oligosaccharide flippase family protein [Ilumatobacter sp.]|nr:oligosaccharide flippase family protein [Ilumatobacter sp.]
MSATARAGRRLVDNIVALVTSQLLGWVMSIVLIVVVSRSIGAVSVGHLQVATTWWALAAVFIGAGTSTVVTLDVARDRDAGATLLGAVYRARLLVFVLVTGVVALASALLGQPLELRLLLVVLGVNALFTTFADVAGSTLQGYEDLVAPSRIAVISRFIGVVPVLIAVTVFDAQVIVVAVIGAVASAVAVVLLHQQVRTYCTISYVADSAAVRAVLRRGLPYLGGALALTLYREIDVFVMSALLDFEPLGWYAAADRLVSSTLFLPTVVAAAFFPVVARMHAADEREATHWFGKVFDSMLLVSLPAGLGLVVVAQPLVDLVLGDEFSRAGPVLALLGVMLIFTFHTTLVGQFAVATGREVALYLTVFGAALLTIPLDLAFVPWTDRRYGNGAIGGALSYIVTEVVILVVGVVWIAPGIVTRSSGVRVAKCAVASGVMAVAAWQLRELPIVVPVAVAGGIYVVMLVVLRVLHPDELDRVERAAARVRRRFGSATDDGA